MIDHQRLYGYGLLVQALAVVIKLGHFQIVNWRLRICYWALAALRRFAAPKILVELNGRNGSDALKAAFVLDFRGAARMVRQTDPSMFSAIRCVGEVHEQRKTVEMCWRNSGSFAAAILRSGYHPRRACNTFTTSVPEVKYMSGFNFSHFSAALYDKPCPSRHPLVFLVERFQDGSVTHLSPKHTRYLR